jgi:hypothetical protein
MESKPWWRRDLFAKQCDRWETDCGSLPLLSSTPVWSGIKVGSYPTLEWFDTTIRDNMVYVAQLAECLIVIQEVMGSTPIIHTNSLQRTRLRQVSWEWVVGDIIVCTTKSLIQEIGGMRVVDQNYLCPRSSMEENLWLRTTRWEFESLRGYKRWYKA